MKIIHIESGLGNQMLSYCSYFALKKLNPDEKVYLETMIFDIPECDKIISQWNGYELGRIFHIDTPNLKDLFDREQWEEIVSEVRNSNFWNNGWKYGGPITKVLNKHGLNFINTNEWEEISLKSNSFKKRLSCIKTSIENLMLNHVWGYAGIKTNKQHKRTLSMMKSADYSFLFPQSNDNLFIGMRLDFRYKNSGIEQIDEEIRKTFVFPKIEDEQNQKAMDKIRACNSVAIHVRRGDMLKDMVAVYKSGYFKKAVNYIRERVEKPVFFIFTNPGSVEWCKKNASNLGLSIKDEIYFVNWNKGSESFRDMQLMAACKHQIVTNSTFGWWAAYLNDNPNKITCSPYPNINTTNYF